jgi:hypothetical protein
MSPDGSLLCDMTAGVTVPVKFVRTRTILVPLRDALYLSLVE